MDNEGVAFCFRFGDFRYHLVGVGVDQIRLVRIEFGVHNRFLLLKIGHRSECDDAMSSQNPPDASQTSVFRLAVEGWEFSRHC